jgi:hypothetical protein
VFLWVAAGYAPRCLQEGAGILVIKVAAEWAVREVAPVSTCVGASPASAHTCSAPVPFCCGGLFLAALHCPSRDMQVWHVFP